MGLKSWLEKQGLDEDDTGCLVAAAVVAALLVLAASVAAIIALLWKVIYWGFSS